MCHDLPVLYRFPDRDEGFCTSAIHQPTKWEIYRTAKECCEKQFAYSSACEEQSKNSIEERDSATKEPETLWGTKASNPKKFFPDLINLNCFFGVSTEKLYCCFFCVGVVSSSLSYPQIRLLPFLIE